MRERAQRGEEEEVQGGTVDSSDCVRISYRNLTTYIVQAANYRSIIPPSGGFCSIPASSSAAAKPPISSNRILRTENVPSKRGLYACTVMRCFHMTHMIMRSDCGPAAV